VLIHASVVCEGMLASVNSVKKMKTKHAVAGGIRELSSPTRGNLRNVPHLIFRKLPLDNFPHSAICIPQNTRAPYRPLYEPCTSHTGRTGLNIQHAPAVSVMIIVVHFHLCSLVGRYTVLEVWTVRRPMRVCCGSRWGRCALFINILDSLVASCYGHVHSIRPVRPVWPVHVHTLPGAVGAWFTRTPRRWRIHT